MVDSRLLPVSAFRCQFEMPGGAKKCKGCSALVVNPVTCHGCKVACHPGPSCLSRSGHPWFDKSLLNCRAVSPTAQTAVSHNIASPAQSLSAIPTDTLRSLSELPSADMIRDIVSDLMDLKLAAFREDILKRIKEDLGVMRSDIESLSDRVKAIEEKPAISAVQLPAPSTDDVIEEWNDRELRSKNIIIFGMPEPREASPELIRSADLDAARGVLNEICPLGTQTLGVHRLGKPGKTTSRPLCVRLDSAAEAKRILQSKHRYKGPFKISDDKTRHQRGTLSQLRAKLRDLHDLGETHMTIRYSRGVPKIVSGRPHKDSSQKN